MCSERFRSLIFIILLFVSSVCFAEDNIVLDLKGCIERAVRFHPELGELKQDIEIYKTKLNEAQAAVFPQIELMALGGPSPKAEKEAISPNIKTDVKSTTINGIFGMITMQVLQPIYTFGKIAGYKTAAEAGIKVSEAELEKKRSEIILKTKELYWSLCLVRELRILANEIKKQLEKAITRLEDDLKKEIPSADELTIYKLKAHLGEVKRNLNEIDKNEAVIIEALKFMTALSNKKVDIITEPLKYQEFHIKLDELVTKASVLRPEMLQIKQGLKARQALIDVEKSNLYPQIFLLAKGSLAAATNRDRIHNPYIFDALNDSMFGVVLGMKLNIDFGITKGKIREAEIEYQKIIEKKRLAETGIPVQIIKAYFELEEASKSAKDMEEAFQYAKKFLVTADANIDMGIGETKDLADAVVLYATTRINHLKALYNQKIAFANLIQASGLDKEEREVK